MAGIDAEKNMYRHLMDVMERLEKAEKEIKRLKVYQEAEIRKLKKAHQEDLLAFRIATVGLIGAYEKLIRKS